MTPRPDRIPFAPLPARRPNDTLYRAAVAHFRASVLGQPMAALIRNDPAVEFLITTRTAPDPATTTTSGNASQLALSALYDAAVSVSGPVATPALIPRGLSIDLTGFGAMTIPSVVASADDAGGFIAQGSPIPVRKLSFAAGVMLNPTKMAVILPFSNELAEHSNLLSILKRDLSQAWGLVLDKQIFSDNAAVANTSPAGLLYNISAITVSDDTDVYGAMQFDIRSLIDALGDGSGKRHRVCLQQSTSGDDEDQCRVTI